MFRPLYRAYQFFAAIKAGLPVWAGGMRGQLTAADAALVAKILTTPQQQELFAGMPPNDRRHALAVARTLQQAGYTHPALLQAALLHDVGKSAGQPILHRVLIVLLKAFWPAALHRLSTPRPRGPGQEAAVSRWRRPFVTHARHAALGADRAKNAACPALAVSLIARHEDALPEQPAGEEDALLAALQWADDLN